MSLRRRIAVAAALAVAAVAVAISVIGYVSTRSHLVGQLKGQLHTLAAPYLEPHGRPVAIGQKPPPHRAGGGDFEHRGEGHREFQAPSPPGFGAAPGYFQVVHADGSASRPPGEKAALPVDPRAVAIAKRAHGSFFTTATVNGVHLQILTVGDPFDRWAVQIALPLTSVDSVLNGLLLPYGLLIAGGVLLAALLGFMISRTALAPIERFLHQTEDVTSELEHPRRLEETGASELRRLAASFNQTLDALEQSIEAQRNLVADASHELRTPIAALRSNVQIFLESGRLPAGERQALQQSILAELDELTQVVANVVELARGSGASAHREQVELDVLVYDAVDRAQRRAPQIEFNVDLEPTLIEGVPDRIGRAITNVIDNARKWSPPDAAIEVRLTKESFLCAITAPASTIATYPTCSTAFTAPPTPAVCPARGWDWRSCARPRWRTAAKRPH